MLAITLASCTFSAPEVPVGYGFDAETVPADAVLTDLTVEDTEGVPRDMRTPDSGDHSDSSLGDVGPCTEFCEQCNGIDDDGDGVVDEAAEDVGNPCDVNDAVGVCTDGRLECVEGRLTCTSLTQPSEELCDEQDNDCDGQIDEGVLNPCGGCSEIPVEICDGEDNDCDGILDEGVLNACGECGDVPEDVCDGLDNDCNGIIDDTCPCVDGAREPCGSDVGACQPGERACRQGVWGDCIGQINPRDVEECNGRDDDCDGRTDEALSRSCGSNVGICRPGQIECRNGMFTACLDEVTPRNERNARACDGLDNDCDGAVDETFAPSPTTCGRGECRREGRETCEGGRVSDSCQAGAPQAEQCDGLDNDCDGSIDERLSRACGEGPCGQGTQSCQGGVWQACRGGGGGAAEVCDGQDNDCDGRTDEDLTRACGSDVGRCRAGTQSCVDGAWAGCAGAYVGPMAESCDGADNDCDGSNDEGLTRACGENIGSCRAGTQACVGGDWGACGGTYVGPAIEACDGADNDCDGATDEGVTRECGSNVGECSPGVQLCQNGNFGVCMGGTLGEQEGQRNAASCDGLDNDCDGRIDEDFADNLCCITDPACRGQLGCFAGNLAVCDGNLN